MNDQSKPSAPNTTDRPDGTMLQVAAAVELRRFLRRCDEMERLGIDPWYEPSLVDQVKKRLDAK